MHYQLCPRCKFRVSLNKSLCPTCGYSMTAAKRSYQEEPTTVKKKAPVAAEGGNNWLKTFFFGAESQESKEKRADGTALS